MYEKDGIIYAGENNKVFSIVSVRNLGNYNLLILFSNHQERIVDCKKLLQFEIFEELKDITIRKMSYLLKVIDRKGHYFAQIQGMYSGMVQFKEEPIHWIFGDDSRELKKDIMSLDSFNDKFSKVSS